MNYPKVNFDKTLKVFVSFYIDSKRHRLFNGKRINSTINPNSFPISERKTQGKLLAAEVYKYILEGGVFKEYRSPKTLIGVQSDLEYLEQALRNKLNGEYSNKYKTMIQFVFDEITRELYLKNIDSKKVLNLLGRYTSNTSRNTIRRHLNVLINEARFLGMKSNPMELIKSIKSKAILHKPFNDVRLILEDIKVFNYNLYLCCLITYGCLLRPHREVRELCWGDFTADLKFIKLSGERNKSGKNRVVPVPIFIRELLKEKEVDFNIFSGTKKPHNQDYFKTLWSRFKKQSNVLEEGQTLYSFRHSGSINIFKRTGSLTKLQQSLGHSSLKVSITYLRGLEVTELKEEDMPTIL